MSGQFLNRKTKAATSKPDIPAEEAAAKLRRSGRRRNVRYTFDFGDYLDDDEYSFVEEEEDERRREKKIELLLKLHSSTATRESPSVSSSSASDDDHKPSKKRKLINCQIDDDDDDENEENEENEENDCDEIEEEDEVKGEKREEGTSEVDYAPGTPIEPASECPLPDKKILELILQKLQKKDIYGVYAEPVDPKELPDYHDIIENPMDFSTIKSKLSNGSYANLEQLESDIFLLCSNAMLYNEPHTIYYKQARAIQDLAKRKFQKLRIGDKYVENQMKSEPKRKPVSVFKNQIRRQLSQTEQEPIGSGFSTDPTSEIVDHTRNASDVMLDHTRNASDVMQAGVIDKTSSLDVLVGQNHFVIDTSVDKLGESLPGRSTPPTHGRTSPTQEEGRTTYSTGGQPNASSDSTFSPFDGETKQLIPVGLYVEHAYARSLARFAGTLGHVAWRVASNRINQILDPGSKFGRGWVVEYDPLPTPVIIPDNCDTRADFFAKPQHADNASKHEVFTNPAASGDGCVSSPLLEEKLPFQNPSLLEVTTSSSGNNFREEPSVRESILEGNSSFSCSNGTTISGSSVSRFLHPTSQLSSLVESSKKVAKPVDSVGPFSANHNSAQLAMGRWVCNNAEAPMPNSAGMILVNRSPLPSASFKQSNINGVAFRPLLTDALLNEKPINYAAGGGNETPLCSKMNKVGPNSYEQEVSDPVQLMKLLTEKNKTQQNPANQSAFSCPSIPSVAQSLNREDSSIAAGVARSWMMMGSGGLRPTVNNMGLQKNQILAEPLCNATHAQQSQFSRFRGDFPAPVVNFQSVKSNYPFHGSLPQPFGVGSAVQLQNQSMGVPQLAPSGFSGFQAQYPWKNVSPHTQQAQKQGTTCPPDLNVSFQSSGSPGRPSPGVVVDSRHPDLALQL